MNGVKEIEYRIFCYTCPATLSNERRYNRKQYGYYTKNKVKARRIFSLHYHILGCKVFAYSTGGKRGGYRLRWDLNAPPR